MSSYVQKMTDPSRRPLQFPHWHIPYLEKHRIFELFKEVTRELVIRQPDDHVLFMKQILQNASKARDVPRTILLGSPKVNTNNIARELAKSTGQMVITERAVLRFLGKYNQDKVSDEKMASALAVMVRTNNAYDTGWIIVNCVRTVTTAKALISKGILPTHVIQFIAPFYPPLNELLYCQVPENWPECRRNLTELRKIFHKTLKEVYLKDKSLSDIVSECVNISKTRKASKYVKPRVVILGPRGCGRKTQARMLHEVMGLVHIDFEYLLCQIWNSSTELGERLRSCRKEVCFHPELLSKVVNKRILDDDCVRHGWVLTGYPFTVEDFKYLDCLDTPPNRVIFLECDLNVCRDRIKPRKINVYTGSATNINLHPEAEQEKSLKTHPKDQPDVLEAELNYYCENYGSLRKYCKDTAVVVNGDQSERWVNECIVAFILGSNPPGSPRKGLSHEDDSKMSSDTICCGCCDVDDKVVNAYYMNV